MSCISSSRRAQLLERLNRYKALLTYAYDALDSLHQKGGIKSYKFDSGEGQQQVTYRTPEQAQNAISSLEASIDSITRTLNNTGNTPVRVRRY